MAVSSAQPLSSFRSPHSARPGGGTVALRGPRGFTIIELMVVMAVIGILAAILLPAIQQIRESARASDCQNRLRQLGLALQSYENTHHCYPPSFVRQLDGSPPPPPGAAFGTLQYRSHWTGFHLLLPFIEQQALHAEFDFRKTWLSSLTDINDRSMWPSNQTIVPTYLCPSAPHTELKLGGSFGAAGQAGSVASAPDGGGFSGSASGSVHWMAGSPGDYSFSHGADVIRALPGADPCPEAPLHFWRKWPARVRGPFGYSSDCRPNNVLDGLSNTFFLGEKSGGLLTYSGWNASFPTLKVEYPWAMAAVTYFASTGGEGVSGSAWVVGPFAVTQDIRLPDCPGATSLGEPYPMNPFPREVPMSSTERPFYSFQSAHRDGAYFLFGDGAVRKLKESIDQNVYRSLSTIAGTDPVSEADF